jgi:hypothetical protein
MNTTLVSPAAFAGACANAVPVAEAAIEVKPSASADRRDNLFSFCTVSAFQLHILFQDIGLRYCDNNWPDFILSVYSFMLSKTELSNREILHRQLTIDKNYCILVPLSSSAQAVLLSLPEGGKMSQNHNKRGNSNTSKCHYLIAGARKTHIGQTNRHFKPISSRCRRSQHKNGT